MSKDRLVIIDGHSQIYKAYYGIKRLSNSKGFPTNAIYGFLLSLGKVVKEIHPEKIAVALDSKEPSFRVNLYPEYKANRMVMPEDLQMQMGYIQEIIECLGIKVFRQPGVEADDLIGLLANLAAKKGNEVYILTADKDLFQLVNESVKIINAGKLGEEFKVLTKNEVKEKLGVYPEQVTDYLGMVGDSSDNIPGIPGVGPKTALSLLEQFGCLENMLNNIEQIKNEKLREKVRSNIETAKLSKQLATIALDLPFEADLDELRLLPPKNPKLAKLYKELEFLSLLKEVGGIGAGGLAQEKQTDSLFSDADFAPEDIVLSNAESAQSAGEENDASDTPSDDEDESNEDMAAETSALSNIPYISGDYRILYDIHEIEEFVKSAYNKEWLAFDTETTGTNTMTADLVGISMSVEEGSAVYIPVGHEPMMSHKEQPSLEKVKKVLSSLFDSEKIKKCGQNLKYDIKILHNIGIKVENAVFDTLLAAYLLNPDRMSNSLKLLSVEYLNLRMTPIDALIGKGKNAISMDKVEVEKAGKYSCADADATIRLTNILSAKIKDEHLSELMEKIEVPLIDVLIDMEETGVKVDREHLKKLGEMFRDKLSGLEADAYKIAGRSFNLNSPKQVAEILFNELKLNPQQAGKTGYSTNVAILDKLSAAHPLPAVLLQHRSIEKLRSTYADALINLINDKTGKIHTSFNQTIVTTGRLSSSNPNLQNIPIRSEQGREIRKAFIPESDDNILISADYSQIELRILASLSADKSLVAAFNEGQDIHKLTASKLFHVFVKDVTEEMRDRAKVINFGIIYGMTGHRLSNELKISRISANKFIEDYFKAYPGVREWTSRIIASAREKGYAETLLGRRRYIEFINSKNTNLRLAAERIAVNMPVQGTSADMIKIAMINIHRRLKENGYSAKMILQVHDELIFDVPLAEKEMVAALIRREMENALPLNVPVKADVKFGRNWGEC